MQPHPLRLWAALTMVVSAGCAGYQLGPTNGLPAGLRSVQVEFFENKTFEPRLVDPVAQALRRNLQEDGTYRLSTSRPADVVVDGVILELDRSALSFEPEDVITARDLSLSLLVHVVARERVTGRVLLDENVRGLTTIRVGADLANAERQALPLLAEDLARNITFRLVDGTW